MTRVQAVGRLMRTLHAIDCQLIAEEAVIAWLDSVAPESRIGAFEAWVSRIRWRLDEGP